MIIGKSKRLFDSAQKKIPGGVNSPVRAWHAVTGVPRFIARGKGAHVIDIDGNEYIDYVGSWGPLILGHAHPYVTGALQDALRQGTTFGAPTERELQMAETVCRLIPSIEKIRLVSSGTEATMSAIRLARAFTKRSKIVKFDGCYHGHADGLLVKAGSGVVTLGLPDSPGVVPALAAETLIARYNDITGIERIFSKYGNKIAAVIVEPVCANIGVIPPASKFLANLASITRRYGSLLIFDEVVTGFRLSPGGAQEVYRVRPDLTCLGKILGGGLPLAAFGGRRDIMNLIAPLGPVYQAGTLSGNPLAVTAGLATLQQLSRHGTYQTLEKKGKYLAQSFAKVLAKYKTKATVNRAGSMMTLFFGVARVSNADEARQCDREKFARFFHGMLERGVYLPPAPYEAMMISLSHSNADLRKTVAAFESWCRSDRH
ncbi:MAG TPA: glutamate-1-semialdehyde 2,1-aminomutase [Candidatus Binatia bacterium]|nr:glutamate-1-semialdehyde 2,1-aminomutase [Candidatus Binatia bacterium]